MKLSPSTSVAALALAVAMTVASVSSSVHADPFTFGVMGDTQWSGVDPTGNNINTVAVNQINACNAAFINAGVSFVIQVGDLCDSNNSTNAGLQTRLNANAALDAAGIPFYGLRGNHESGSGSQAFFNANYLPTSTAERPVAIGPDTSSYTVTVNNTKIVLLDYTSASGNLTNVTNAISWMGTQLSAADHEQAFVFQHKNLLGQNHKDNVFGSNNDANLALQNSFISTLQNNGVRYNMSGHDHMHYRSVVTSPDGESSVQQIISASDSYKYYDPSTPYSGRDNPITQELDKTGYYLYTVDGPRVTGKYYATTPQANGDVPANPNYTMKEKFGYSLNGIQKLVQQGGSFAITDNTAWAIARGETGYKGTTGKILSGTNGSTAMLPGARATTKTVDTGWAPAEAWQNSDEFFLWGIQTFGDTAPDTFAVSLSYGSSVTDPSAVRLLTQTEEGSWIEAVDANFGGTKNLVVGAYSTSYGLGTYGYEAASKTVWAVVNNADDFVIANPAAAPVPEPASLALVAIGGMALLVRRRNA